jgi:hypothetical protein
MTGCPGLDQRIDDHPPSRARSPGRALDSDRQLGRECYLAQPGKHVDETCIIVPGLDAGDDLTGAIDDADGVGGPAPVQTSVKWHVLSSLGCSRLTRAGRSCGSLTDRRSGRQALALHPVVRRYLPAPAVRLGLARAVQRLARNGRHGRMLGLADTNAAYTVSHLPLRRCTSEHASEGWPGLARP